MYRIKVLLIAAILMCMGVAGSAFAIIGVGIHYTLDYSVKMDQSSEMLIFDDLKLNTTTGFVNLPFEWEGTIFEPEDIPVYFDRGDMGRTPFGLGAKAYIDVLPLIIEVSGTFVSFQYDGKIKYPTSITVNANPPTTPGGLLEMMDQDIVTVQYDSISTNLEDLNDGPRVPGVSKTPYAKLDLGITVRKYLKLPVIDKVLRPYGGLGFNMIFATPVPSAGLVRDAIGGDLTGEMTVDQILAVMSDQETPKKVVDELLNRLMTPHFGMNVTIGLMLKPPVLPVGFYVDGKYQIPFGKLDADANVTGVGFLVNAGLVLHI